MKLLKDKIRKVLKSHIDVRFRISLKQPSEDDMDKKLFVELITALREIDDRRDFMADEIGMDMTHYEDKFFLVIENLIKLTFDKQQQGLIHMHVYKVLEDDPDWDGTVKVVQGKKESNLPFKTAEEVWEVIKKVGGKS